MREFLAWMDPCSVRFFLKKVVVVVRPLIDKKECILLPASLVCGTPKGPHTFTSLVPMLKFPSMPEIIVSFILHILRAVS